MITPGKFYWRKKLKLEKTEPHWLELVDPEGWYHAIVKFDGCIHFNRYCNIPIHELQPGQEADIDYLHICDLDDTIARLQALRDIAKAHFGEKWPNP